MEIAIAAASRQIQTPQIPATGKTCWDWLYEMRPPLPKEMASCLSTGSLRPRLLQALLDPARVDELPALQLDALAANDLESACAANIGGIAVVFEAGRNFTDFQPWFGTALAILDRSGQTSPQGRGALVLQCAIAELVSNGNLYRVATLLEQLADLAEAADSDALRILHAAARAYHDVMSGRLLVVNAIVSDALHLSPQADSHPIPKIQLQAGLALLNTVRGHAGEARERLAALVRQPIFDQVPGALWLVCMGHYLLSLAAGGPREEVDACAERIRARSISRHSHYHRSYLHYALGAAALLTGHPETALFHARTASELGRHCQSSIAERTATVLAIQALNDLGQHEEAFAVLIDHTHAWREAGANLLVATAAIEEASMLLQRGDTTSAREALRRARAVLPPGEDLPRNLRSDQFITDLIARLEPQTVHLNAAPRDKRPVQITTFGELRVEINGQVIYDRDWHGARGKTLLKALIVLGGHKVAAERLADLLWPDADGDIARNNLKVSLWRLRRLGCRKGEAPLPWIAIQHGHISLVDSLCRVDCIEFERELAGALASGEPERLHAALAAFTNDFLAGDDSEAWLVSHREHLRKQYLRGACVSGKVSLHPPSAVDPTSILEPRIDNLIGDGVHRVMP